MDIQNAHGVMTVAQAKARLLEYGEQITQERRAMGPMGTWRGKALAGGAVGALLIGLALAGPVRRLVLRPPPAQPPAFGKWLRKKEHRKDVKKAAVGGISLGLLFKLLQPALPHLTQYATRRYMAYRVAKAAAEEAARGAVGAPVPGPRGPM